MKCSNFKFQSSIKRYIMFFVIALCTLHFEHSFAAETLSQINAQIKKTEQQQKQIDEKVKTTTREIERTRKDLVRVAGRVGTLESERGAMSKKIAELERERDTLTAELAANREHIADSAASILFIANHPGFDSENMRDYVLISAALSGASQNFNAEIERAQTAIKRLDEIYSARATEQEKLDRTAKKYAAEKNDLDKLLKNRNAQNQKLLTEKKSVASKLRELSARAKNISELSSGVGSSQMSADSSFSLRKLNAPVRGRLTVKFAEKTALGLQSDGWRIRVDGGALVVAPADGVVKFADNFRGFGRVVIMSHKNGYNTVMTNLGQLSVAIGQELLAGEPLGRMDSVKREMYLEVRRGDRAVDPARLFREP